MLLHDVSVVRPVSCEGSGRFEGSQSKEAKDGEGRNDGGQEESEPATENERSQGGRETFQVTASSELQGLVAQGIARDDEEDADCSGTLVPEAQEGELENVVVGLARTPALSYCECLV